MQTNMQTKTKKVVPVDPLEKRLRRRRRRGHKPGSVFTGRDSVKYRVDKDGVVRPAIDRATQKKKRKAQRKARRKNR